MRLLRRTPLLASAVAISLLAISANAQTTNLPNLSSGTATTASVASNTGSAATNTGSGSTGIRAGSASSSGAVITGSGVSGQATTAPVITGTTATADGALTGLPTLPGGFQIVAPSVPPTANAPYMQTSNLPEGTVFIVVGAILGFMAMSVLLWRGLVAWSLHRSVKRAAQIQNMSDTKSLFRTPGPPPAPFYKYSDRESTISLSALTQKGGKKHTRPTTGSNAHGSNAPSSLFFSPTATAAGAGLATPGNRGSNYLPAGYYASGASAPAGGAGHVPIGHGPSISLSNLGQQSTGYSRSRSMGPSPPDSPGFSSERHSRYGASSSTLNLNQAYTSQERVPSVYLEDLISENAPLPQPGHVSHSRTNSGSLLRERN